MSSKVKQWFALSTILLAISVLLTGCSSLLTSLTNNSPSTPATSLVSTSSIPKAETTSPSVSLNADNKTVPQQSTETPKPRSTGESVNSNEFSKGKTATSTMVIQSQNNATSKKVISKANYDKIKIGETYEKIKILLGDTGDIVTESGVKGSKNYIVTYLLHGKAETGGGVFLVFKDDKLINKMEVNLQ